MISRRIGKISMLTFFGIAMGWLEAVVVIYIRKIMSVEKSMDLARVFIEQASLLRIEQTREIATIVMLAALALIAERNWWRKFAVFLWVFAIWDIFYYVALRVLIGWPPSLLTIDCLFLIPCPWIAPVWFPIAASITMLAISAWLLVKVREEK